MVVPETLLVGFSMIFLKAMIADGFQTNYCNHGKLTNFLTKLRACMNEVNDSENHNLCYVLQTAEKCLTSNLQECFTGYNVDMTVMETLGFSRNAGTNSFSGFHFQGGDGGDAALQRSAPSPLLDLPPPLL